MEVPDIVLVPVGTRLTVVGRIRAVNVTLSLYGDLPLSRGNCVWTTWLAGESAGRPQGG
jgi:hypothetical protein